MKRRFSFKITALLFVLSTILYWTIGFWVASILDNPGWFTTILFILFNFFIYEIPSRVGPKEFETPLSQFLSFPIKDKAILSISSIVFLIILFVLIEPMGAFPKWVGLILFIVLFVLILYMPVRLFVSEETKQKLNRKFYDTPN